MARRAVSFQVVPHDSRPPWSLRIPVPTLRVLIIAAAALVLGVAFLVYDASRIHYQAARAYFLAQRNAELEARVARISELENELGHLDRERQKVRRMLGLEKAPPAIDLTQAIFSNPGYRSDFGFGAAAEDDSLAGTGKNFVPTVLPTVGFIVSKRFGADHPGIDFAAPLGSPVLATADGVVRAVGRDSTYGNYLMIQHGPEYETFYGHLEKATRAVGDSVRTGDRVAFVGSTGVSSGPHLHFEVYYHDRRIDPAGLFVIR